MHPCSATETATSGVRDEIWGFFMVGAAMVCQYHPHGLLRWDFERSVINVQLAHDSSGAGHACICTAHMHSLHTPGATSILPYACVSSLAAPAVFCKTASQCMTGGVFCLC